MLLKTKNSVHWENGSKKFDKKHVSSSVSSSNWLNITILGGIIDSININNSLLIYPVTKIQTMQSNESAQISLLLNMEVEDLDLIVTDTKVKILFKLIVIFI